MRKVFLTFLLTTSVGCLFGQEISTNLNEIAFDEKEDTSNVVSLKDIIATQSEVNKGQSASDHLQKVWGRKVHFNISINNATMETSELVDPDGNAKRKYQSDWGLGLQWGETFKMHKKPIANLLQIGLDVRWMNLNVNHFKADLNYTYNSAEPLKQDGRKYEFYYPWGLEKYEANYGISVGPCVSVTPFSAIGKKWLDFFRMNIYFHVGYSVSFLFSGKSKSLDQNPYSTQDQKQMKSVMDNALLMQWGTGLFTEFGFELTWKFIGVGYSIYNTTMKYKSMDTDNFDKNKTTFKNGNNRVYVTFHF